jgi:hypothetical protein
MESESACVDCFVSAQPENNDQTEMKITKARATTFSISIFQIRKSTWSRERRLLREMNLANCLLSIARWQRNGYMEDKSMIKAIGIPSP